MINLHESIGPGEDRPRDHLICSQTRVCRQTRYRLCCADQDRNYGNYDEITNMVYEVFDDESDEE